MTNTNKGRLLAGLLVGGAAGLVAFQAPPPSTDVAPRLRAQFQRRNVEMEPVSMSGATITFQNDNAAAVTFQSKDADLPARMELAIDGRPVAFGRQAQGGFTGGVTANLAEFRAWQAHLLRNPAAQVEVFEGRLRKPPVVARTVAISPEQVGLGKAIPVAPMGIATNIDPARSLMIVAPSVTQDPSRTRASCQQSSMGPWSFGHIMTQIANQPSTGVSASELSRRWLQRFQFLQVVNDQPSQPVMNVKTQILDKWQQISGGGTNPLDMGKAPFRLLAIVNRVDLRKSGNYGGGDAGEARFVFGAVDPQTCAPLPFLLIFEYGIDKKFCNDIKTWAKQWKNLDTLALGSPQYNAALQAITDQFVKANAAPGKPNGSALNQLRTNEILGGTWNLREYRLTSASLGHLEQVPIKQTPAFALNNSAALTQWATANMAKILSGTHSVPLHAPPGTPFLAADINSGPPNTVWGTAPTAFPNKPTRFEFAVNTCNGCHGVEAPATSFRHVGTAPFGNSTPPLSAFLTGGSMNDPVDTSTVHLFDDLKRRAADMDALINGPCLLQSFKPQMTMIH